MTKHQSSNNNQVPNSNDGTLFGDSVIGVYLELGIWLLEFQGVDLKEGVREKRVRWLEER